MFSLRESLEEMMEASANKVLLGDGTYEGKQALARMTLLLSMIERLDAGGGSWDDCDLLPEAMPILSGVEFKSGSALLQ